MKKTGVELIAEERNRQITKEGWTPEHDDQHTFAELSKAAENYIIAAQTATFRDDAAQYHKFYPNGNWPWAQEWWKPSNDPVANLVKAGALIAAEIDRLQRVNARAEAAVEKI